jgi:hypothetical protein
MANDRYWYVVIEESLPEGTIAEHRKSRRANAKRAVPAKRERPSTDQPVLWTPAHPGRSA